MSESGEMVDAPHASPGKRQERDRNGRLESIRRSSEENAPSFIRHVDMAHASATKPVVLPRTLQDLSREFGEADYAESTKLSRFTSNCHVGQRKLSLALIEFLTEVHRNQTTMGPVTVVYAGASIVAAMAAHDLFPGDVFICFDPVVEMTLSVAERTLGLNAKRRISERVAIKYATMSPQLTNKSLQTKPIVLFTGSSSGTFSDSTCAWAKEVARLRGQEIAFASDIRKGGHGAAKECAIAEDMVNQARWALAMRTRFYFFKFRLPFDMSRDIRARYAKLSHGVASEDADKVLYLDGTCVLQKYAPEFSTEMRLIGTRIPTLVEYDIRSVERLFAPFNVVHRGNTCFVPYPSRDGKRPISPQAMAQALPHIHQSSGCHGAFDIMGEACAIRDAVELNRGGDKAFSDSMSRFHSLFTGRSGPPGTTTGGASGLHSPFAGTTVLGTCLAIAVGAAFASSP